MSFPYQKKPRPNLSLNLSQPIVIKPQRKTGLKHTNSVCLPVTKSVHPTLHGGGASMTSRLSFSNHKSSSHPTINHASSCHHPSADDTSMTTDAPMPNQHSTKMVTSMEVASRISSSSESEEDGEGWLLLNERSKPWPEPDQSEVNIAV
ncbi:uncharacterized protein LOC119585122 [Penaeus monodon]|uniref:uncharacterized protein LOC119585122 n=1 Tax=Penaeus monodon TaxID=6687 RepID=UPI0018A6E298|nr:uncharacterized protein LOC119585122 [Penaeus monodon]XP_047494987.1 uncharacterized protein LOC125043081 [Penaeus chinensis]